MSGEFLVRSQGLQTAATDISTGAASLRSILDEMDSELTPLKAQWTGDAASEYQAVKIRWDAALGRMQEILREIGSLVDASNQDFSAAERRNASVW